MPAWTLWLLLAALLILPILLRLYVGDELHNEITHESGDDEEDGRGRDPGPDGLLAAA